MSYTTKKWSDLDDANDTDAIELVGLQDADNVKVPDAAMLAQMRRLGLRTRFIIPFGTGIVSTRFSSSQKRIAAKLKFDPANWDLQSTTTATLYIELETTNAANAAYAELYQLDGTGGPQSIAIVNTTSLTSTLLTANVSASFKYGAPAANFLIQLWINTANGYDYATLSGAWVENQP